MGTSNELFIDETFNVVHTAGNVQTLAVERRRTGTGDTYVHTLTEKTLRLVDDKLAWTGFKSIEWHDHLFP